ncbi:MAG: hypothetical protein ABIE74_05375 [Pseudomonadota bacterium]
MLKSIATGQYVEWGSMQMDSGYLKRAKSLHSIAAEVVQASALADHFRPSSFSSEIDKTIALSPFDTAREKLVALMRGSKELIHKYDQKMKFPWSTNSTLSRISRGSSKTTKIDLEKVETIAKQLLIDSYRGLGVVVDEDAAKEIILDARGRQSECDVSDFAVMAFKISINMYSVGVMIETNEEKIETTAGDLHFAFAGARSVFAYEERISEVLPEDLAAPKLKGIVQEAIYRMKNQNFDFKGERKDLESFLREICSSSFNVEAVEEIVANIFEKPFDPERKFDDRFVQWFSDYIFKNLMPTSVEVEMPDSWRDEVDLSEYRSYEQIRDDSSYQRFLAIQLISRIADPRFWNIIQRASSLEGDYCHSADATIALGLIGETKDINAYRFKRKLTYADSCALGLMGNKATLEEMKLSSDFEDRLKGVAGLFKMDMVKRVYNILENINASAAHLWSLET